MITDELNDRMTMVGKGTPAGELHRRYWIPVGVEAEVARLGVKRVRILGEDLALFQSPDGKFGLVSERCPHRGASLSYGFPDGDGLRCAYHGWMFSTTGECLEQPNQTPESSRLRERARITGYPVQALGGLLFAYMGGGVAPALPRYDLFERKESSTSFRDIGYAVIPCNWLQIMENSFDPVHVEWLHGRYFNYKLEKEGLEANGLGGRHVKIGFDLVDYGIIKRRLREGQSEDAVDWRVGHPVIFPNILKVGGKAWHTFQIRVPVDDTHTLHFWYSWYELPTEYSDLVEESQRLDGFYPVKILEPDGSFSMDTIDSQDVMAWVTQGNRAERSGEHLSSSDQGVALYRNLLRSQLDIVESGGRPMNVRSAVDPGAEPEFPLEEKEVGLGGESNNPMSTYLRTQAANSPRVQFLNAHINARLPELAAARTMAH